MRRRWPIFLSLGTLLIVVLYLNVSVSPDNESTELESGGFADRALPDATTQSPLPEQFHQEHDIIPGPRGRESSSTALTLRDIPQGALRQELETLPGNIRRSVLREITDLAPPQQDLANSIHTTSDGHLYYVCSDDDKSKTTAELRTGSTTIEESVALLSRPDSSTGDPSASQLEVDADRFTLETPITHVPIYESNPNSQNTIFLDFNGHVVKDTKWNEAFEQEEFNCGPMVLKHSSTTDTFGPNELSEISRIWRMVAHHFKTFDANVTTKEPEVFNSKTVHVLITSSLDLDGLENPASSTAHGVAFVNVFGKTDFATSSPVFVYSDYLDSHTQEIGNVTTHEIGHYLGLSHDGDQGEEYYPGHHNPDSPWPRERWAPIMGRPKESLNQWSKGEYFGANNTEDDLQIIGSHIPVIPDLIPGTKETATPLTMYGSSISQYGVINNNLDEDWYSVVVGELGFMTLYISPALNGYGDKSALDILVELYDSSGQLVQDFEGMIELREIPPGTYYIRIKGDQFGDPMSDPPTGYTSYGNIGSYLIQGRVLDNSLESPFISEQPVSLTVVSGTYAEFRVRLANFKPSGGKVWEYSLNGGISWETAINTQGDGNDDYSVLKFWQVRPSMDGMLIRCKVENHDETIYTDTVTLNVVILNNPFEILHNPEDVLVTLPDTTSAVFSYGVEELPHKKLQVITWEQYDPRSERWLELQEYHPVLTVNNVTQEMNGTRYRCRVINHMGEFNPQEVILSVHSKPEIQLAFDQYDLPLGTPLFLRSDITGGYPDDGFTYQWQRMLGGETEWSSVQDDSQYTGSQTTILSMESLDAALDNSQWRVLVSNAVGTSESQPINVTINQQPIPAAIKVDNFSRTTLLIRSDGSLWGTGKNGSYALGLDNDQNQYAFTQIVADGVVDCATGGGYSIFLKEDRTLWGMGSNADFALGLLDRYDVLRTPARIAAEFNDIISCVATRTHSLFLRADGSLWGMGSYMGIYRDITSTVPVKLADDVAYLSDEYYILHSGHLVKHIPRGTDDYIPAPDEIEYTYAHPAAYAITVDGRIRCTPRTSEQFVFGWNVSRISLAENGLFFWKHDGSHWKYDYYTQAISLISTDDQMLICDDNPSFLINKDSGWLWGFGYNTDGQLGLGSEFQEENVTRPIEARVDLKEPAVPDNLEVNYSRNYTLVYWSPAKGARSYNVYRGPSDDFNEATLVAANLTRTMLADIDADTTLLNRYWVESVNMAGTSLNPVPSSKPPVEVATDLSLTSVNGLVNIHWEGASDASSFNIWKSFNSNPSFASMVESGVTSRDWTRQFRETDPIPYFWIQSVNEFGTSPLIGPVTGTFFPELNMTAVSFFRGFFRFSWEPIPGALAYRVYRGTTPFPEDAWLIYREDQLSTKYFTFLPFLNPLPTFWVQAVYADGSSKMTQASVEKIRDESDFMDWSSFRTYYFKEYEQSISSWNADPDGDNLTNFEEFIYYGNPRSPDNPFLTFNPLNFTVPFGHKLSSPVAIPVRYGLPNIQYILEESTDLQSWEEISASNSRQSSILTDHDGRTFFIVETKPDYTKVFFRIRIIPTEVLE